MTSAASDSSEHATSGEAAHADKYNDPRAKITNRGIGIGIGVLILAIIGAGVSIYARKTRLTETTRFWGQETITGLQLAERIELVPRDSSDFPTVDLSGTPGLGLLRRLLLDERNYDWTTESDERALVDCEVETPGKPSCVQLRLTDPTANRIGTIEIDIDLKDGWIGPSDGSRRVQASERVRPKFGNYFSTIINVEQKRYDHRD